MIRLSLILLLLGTTSCRDFRRGWSDWYELKFSSDPVYWTNDQTITPDLFIGELGNDGCYSDYFGALLLWDIKRYSVRFNVRISFDKKKSWMRPRTEWVNYSIKTKSKLLNYQGHYSQVPKLLKLKFDYLECAARKLRKYLKEGGSEIVTDDNIRRLADSYIDPAFNEWEIIQEELGDDISDSKLKPIREMIDKKLEELKDFDSRVNSDL